MRAGIDGFAIDAWAGGDNAEKVFSALIKVAEEKDYPFEITICLDAGIRQRGADQLDQVGAREPRRQPPSSPAATASP